LSCALQRQTPNSLAQKVRLFSIAPGFSQVNTGISGYGGKPFKRFLVISAESSTWLKPGENEISIGHLSFSCRHTNRQSSIVNRQWQ
jgi:hypothetical protein